MGELLNNVYLIVGIVAPLFLILGGWTVRRIKVANRADTKQIVGEEVGPVLDKIDLVAERMTRLEMQFGPNGGGLRQAVNETQASVANLSGQVTAHVAQAADDRHRFDDAIIRLMDKSTP